MFKKLGSLFFEKEEVLTVKDNQENYQTNEEPKKIFQTIDVDEAPKITKEEKTIKVEEVVLPYQKRFEPTGVISPIYGIVSEPYRVPAEHRKIVSPPIIRSGYLETVFSPIYGTEKREINEPPAPVQWRPIINVELEQKPVVESIIAQPLIAKVELGNPELSTPKQTITGQPLPRRTTNNRKSNNDSLFEELDFNYSTKEMAVIKNEEPDEQVVQFSKMDLFDED